MDPFTEAVLGFASFVAQSPSSLMPVANVVEMHLAVDDAPFPGSVEIMVAGSTHYYSVFIIPNNTPIAPIGPPTYTYTFSTPGESTIRAYEHPLANVPANFLLRSFEAVIKVTSILNAMKSPRQRASNGVLGPYLFGSFFKINPFVHTAVQGTTDYSTINDTMISMTIRGLSSLHSDVNGAVINTARPNVYVIRDDGPLAAGVGRVLTVSPTNGTFNCLDPAFVRMITCIHNFCPHLRLYGPYVSIPYSESEPVTIDERSPWVDTNRDIEHFKYRFKYAICDTSISSYVADVWGVDKVVPMEFV